LLYQIYFAIMTHQGNDDEATEEGAEMKNT
jgi:hypothetical protein